MVHAIDVDLQLSLAKTAGFRRRGLGTLVAAAGVRAAAELAGATLAGSPPGGEGADRICRSVGFTPTATAAHLTA
ncbi:MAG TPA: hypothetical protein VGX25_04695 [Actinophytocola sp.]|uniref:hypothetical protein n=1 Tax=Actinophytocola sp. TaxID=1872138 RepID=UPI002DDD812E|nr:hypothetical protein [Actinophytocola sp.]HEV2778680.1 hypothetical protein [Actinophytocola sp.]